MATVTALTAARANTAVASAAITNGNLILTKLDGSTVNVGAVGGGGGSGATNAWLTGTSDPSSGTGVDGDWYLTSTTGKILQKVSGAWVTRITSIIGPQGPAGPGGGFDIGDLTPGGVGTVASTDKLPAELANGTVVHYTWDQLVTSAAMSERIRDVIGTALQNGQNAGLNTNVTVTVDDTNDRISIAASGGGVSNLETVFPVTFAKMLSAENAAPPAASNSAPVGYFRVPFGFTINSVRAFQSVPDNTTATIIDIHQGTSAINTSIRAT